MNAGKFLVFALMPLLLTPGCFSWEQKTTVAGVAFARVRIDTKSGLAIGELAADTVVAGRPCRQGWLHLHPNGIPSAFTASREVRDGRLTVPAGTWVVQHPTGVIRLCAFPSDTKVQGHLCRGTGGPKGVQVSFHPSGALKQFYPPQPTRVDGVPCDSGLVNGWIELHESGRLKSGRLAEDFAHEGRTWHRGERLEFDAAGRLVSQSESR